MVRGVNCLESADGWANDFSHYVICGNRLRLLSWNYLQATFLSILCIIFVFCAMGRVGRHEWITFTAQFVFPQLQECFCTSCVYATFPGESIQRVDCVASFSGYHLAFCCLLNGKRQQAGQGMHGNEATETVCNWRVCSRVSRVALSKFTVWSFTPWKGLENFDINCW